MTATPAPAKEGLPAKQKPSLAAQFTTFTRTTAGLEKTLRFFQALSQICLQLSIESDLIPLHASSNFAAAKSHLALTRRYFRFFNVIDCFMRVGALLGGTVSADVGADTVSRVIELARWSCLGMYLLLEDLTILHATNIYPVAWNNTVLTEGFKFWFYALALSVVGAIWGLFFASTSRATPRREQSTKNEKQEKPPSKTPVPSSSHSVLVKRIVVDGLDLLIPGSFLGWIQLGDLGVGLGMIVSTLVSGRDVWIRAQGG